MKKPDISVVMSVFNSASTLPGTLESILNQEDVALELIVIDDGSTDGSGEILSKYAALDRRLSVVHQKNKGLTASLIRGCALARGKFIARQDAGGDISLPGRLAHQIAFLSAHPDAVMTACGTVIVGPKGEHLYESRQHGEELQTRLRARSPRCFAGPSHHGAVMFRTSAYEQAGGYRDAFRVAQDIDLWRRMAEIGNCLATPDVFYVGCLSKGSISHVNRDLQMRAKQIVLLCAKARKEGRDETEILKSIKFSPESPKRLFFDQRRDAGFYYFIGSVLRKQNRHRARSYFMKAITSWPLHERAWIGLLRSLH